MTEDMLNALPPHSREAEKSVIGAILQSDKAMRKAVKELSKGDFYTPEHAEIFEAARAISGPVDVMTLTNELTKRGTLLGVGGTAYLMEAYRYVPTAVNVGAYIKIVVDKSRERKIMSAAYALINTIQSQMSEASEALDTFRGAVRDVSAGKSEIMTAADVAAETYDYISRRANGEITSLMTGIRSFDNMTGGLLPGDLVVIGARPAVGKSAYAMEIVTNVAKAGKRVLVNSREMQAVQYGIRGGSRLSGINGMTLKTGNIGEQQWEPLAGAFSTFASLPIRFLFKTRSVERTAAIAQEEYDDGGLDLIVVDYLQLMGSDSRTEKRYQEVGAVSRALKELAMTLKVPVIALAQVARPAEKRAAVCPVMSELRESGDIEQDADIIMFLHHPDAPGDKSIPGGLEGTWSMIEAAGRVGLVEAFVKQRMGPIGNCLIDFDPSHMVIRDVDAR